MAIYIDSATIKEIEAARSLGWVRGVTTNPILLAKAGGDVRATLDSLAHLQMEEVFYQLVSPSVEGMQKEMEHASRSAEHCARLNPGYLDPAKINVDEEKGSPEVAVTNRHR